VVKEDGETMTEQNRRGLAGGLATVSFLLVGATLVLIWMGREATLTVEAFNQSDSRLVYALSALPAVLVGMVIAFKMPRNLYGWIWLVLGFSFCLEQFGIAYVTQGVMIAPGSLPMAAEALVFAGIGWILWIGMLSFVLFLFPTGKLPSRRWRPVAWIVLAALAIALGIGWAMPGISGIVPIKNPFGIEGEIGDIVTLLTNVAVYTLFASLFAGVLSIIVRYRSSTGVEQKQLKWFFFGTLLFGAYLVSDIIYELPGVLESVKEALAFSILPVSIGIAIVRHQLFDIDILIRRTLIYFVLTAMLALFYFGAVIVLQQLFRAITGAGDDLAIIISTLAIAALFNPLRHRVQDIIDQRFFRRKYDAQKVLERFAATVRDEVELEKLTGELLNVVNETMQPTSVSLWLKKTDDQRRRTEGNQSRSLVIRHPSESSDNA
jgi:hypothetical protein